MRLSVIINTYNRPDALGQCLASLARQRPAGQPWEVIVADDGGQADLSAFANALDGVCPLRIHCMKHAGRAAARNGGAALAAGERLWFLGDDVLPEPECLAFHALETRPEVAALGPYPQPARRLSPPMRQWTDPNQIERIANPLDAGYCFFFTGNISMSRARFETLGGFDEHYEHYGWEDIDLGLRFELAGGRIELKPQALARHIHPQTSRRALWEREYWVGYTGRRFYEKWKHLPAEKLAPARFWPERPERAGRGSGLRRWLGGLAAAAADTLAPGSALNRALFERMVFSCRLAGFADGATPENLKGIPC